MILYQTGIMLDYNPATDILTALWPSNNPYTLPEIQSTLEILVKSIRNYDVKKLLLNSSQLAIHPAIDAAEYQTTLNLFCNSLTQTRLKRLAQIISMDQENKILNLELGQETKDNVKITFQTQYFIFPAEAINWLTAPLPILQTI